MEPPLGEKAAAGPSRRVPGRTASFTKPAPQQPLGKGALQLNASTTPQALPVKRRGSFQQLKKAGLPNSLCDSSSSHLDSDSSPSIFAIVKKSTHWEKYGTVLVLFAADDSGTDKAEVLQMLSAEGYDDMTISSLDEAVRLFTEREVFPDIVLVDSDNESMDTQKLIKQLQRINPTVAIMVLGSKGGPISAIQALQAGAADYMVKPPDLDELVARVERHVQRQHCIKLEMEKALEDAKQMMQQLMPASLLGDVMLRKDGGGGGPATGAGPGPGPDSADPAAAGAGPALGLNPVAETDFEEQMSELSDENHRLGQKIVDMEAKLELKAQENMQLEARLQAIDRKMDLASDGVRSELDFVAQTNRDLTHKVDELERLLHEHTSIHS